MFIPTWRLAFFIIIVIIVQLILLRNKLGKNEHVSMFTAVAIFVLSIVFSIREMTPPELTLVEPLNFVSVLIYFAFLSITIRYQKHKK